MILKLGEISTLNSLVIATVACSDTNTNRLKYLTILAS